MAAPVIQNVATDSQPGSGSNTTISMSCGSPAAGDLLLALVLSQSGGTRTVDTPSGWTRAVLYTLTAIGDIFFHVFYKVATGSETTQSVTSTGAYTTVSGALFRISGADDPGTTAIVTTADSSASTGGAAAFPSITPTVDESLCFSFCGRDSGDSGTFTPPSGESERMDSNANDMAIGISSFTANASATGTRNGSYTPTWRNLRCVSVAVAPTVATGQPYAKRLGGVQFNPRSYGAW